jgi:carnitine O-acetyltransferase
MRRSPTSNSIGHVKGLVTLPRLPVPDLRKTLDRYLTSLEPLLLEEEQRSGIPSRDAYALRRKWADEFESGIGQVLQERLIGSPVTLIAFRALYLIWRSA